MEVDTPTVHPGLTVDTFAGQLLDRDVPTTAIAVVRGDEVVGIDNFNDYYSVALKRDRDAKLRRDLGEPKGLPAARVAAA